MKTYVLKHFSSSDVLSHLDRNLLYRLFARSSDYFVAHSMDFPDSADSLFPEHLTEYAENFKHPFFDSATPLLDDLEEIETMSAAPYSEIAIETVTQNYPDAVFETDDEHRSLNTALYLHVNHHDDLERIIDIVRMDNPKSFRTLKSTTVSGVFNDSQANITKFADILTLNFAQHQYRGGVCITKISNHDKDEHLFLIRRGSLVAREAILDKTNNLGGIFYCKANWDVVSYNSSTGEFKYSIKNPRVWTTLLYPQAFGTAFFGHITHFETERICNFDVLISEQEHALQCLPGDSIVVAKLTKAKFRIDQEVSDDLLTENIKDVPLYCTYESADIFEAIRMNRMIFPRNRPLESIKIHFEFADRKKENVSLSLANNNTGISRSKYGEAIETWLIERGFFKCKNL